MRLHIRLPHYYSIHMIIYTIRRKDEIRIYLLQSTCYFSVRFTSIRRVDSLDGEI